MCIEKIGCGIFKEHNVLNLSMNREKTDTNTK